MQKCLFLILALVTISSAAWSQANWSPYFMNRERFVHLTPEQQEKVLIKTMEMMVELESKYKRQTASSGYSQKIYEKYVQLLKPLQDFFISSASAGDAKSLNALASHFKTLQTEFPDELCIYGGYISRVVYLDIRKGKDSKKVCTHPERLGVKAYSAKDKARYEEFDKKIKDAYLKGNEKKCIGPSWISCNPVIFGYKTYDTNEPFCVQTSGHKVTNDSINHNVSNECMKLSLSDSPEDGADTKARRLKVLTDAMTQDKSAVDSVHSYVFETCVCADSTNGINTVYKKYIRPHRTCYGMMNTLREVNMSECTGLASVTPKAEEAEEWKKFFGSSPVEFKDPAKTSMTDLEYFKLIELTDVQKLCKSSNTAECEVDCTPKKDSKTGKDLLCKVQSVTTTVSKNGRPQKSVIKEFDPSEYEVKDGESSFTVTAKDKSTFECKVPTGGPACEISVADDEDNTKSRLTLSLSGIKDEPEIKWTIGEAQKDDKKVSIVSKTAEEQKAVIDFKVGEKAVTCEAVIPKLEDGTFTITATPTPEGPSMRVKAQETPTRPAGAYISWSRNGAGVAMLKPVAPKLKKPAAETTGATPGSVQDDGTVAKEVPAVDTTPKGEVSNQDEIVEERTGADYKSCAVLMSKDGKVLTPAPACATIPAMNAGPVNLNNFSAPPRMPKMDYNFTKDGI